MLDGFRGELGRYVLLDVQVVTLTSLSHCCLADDSRISLPQVFLWISRLYEPVHATRTSRFGVTGSVFVVRAVSLVMRREVCTGTGIYRWCQLEGVYVCSTVLCVTET